jgi:hypothetical protein
MSKGAIITLVVAVVIMFVGATFRTVFGRPDHDPNNFTYEEARWYWSSFASTKCKEIKCKVGQGKGTLDLGHYETDDGWVFVFGTETESGETHVLFPADDPTKYRIVEPPK